MSFEAALRELEDHCLAAGTGRSDLEDSIALYERGQALKSHCEAKLKAAEGRLEKIVLGAGGPASAKSWKRHEHCFARFEYGGLSGTHEPIPVVTS